MQKNYRITLRLDKKTKNRVKKIAISQGRSLNTEIIKAIIAHCSVYDGLKNGNLLSDEQLEKVKKEHQTIK